MKFADRPAVRAGSDAVWDRAETRWRCGRGRRARLHPQSRRRRVLRAEARIRVARRDRPRLAVRHLAARFRRAGAARRLPISARTGATRAGDAAPRDPRIDRALYRHSDRALCRPLPVVAGPGAGGGRDHHSDADDYAARGGARVRGRRAGVATRPGNEKINYKVREHSLAKVPVMLVVGRRRRKTARLRCAGSAEVTQEALALASRW